MQDHSGHARDQTRLLGILQQALPTALADRPDENMLGQQVKQVIEFNVNKKYTMSTLTDLSVLTCCAQVMDSCSRCMRC